MITGIKLMGIPVRDQERARNFYRDKLGFEVRADEPLGPGARWIEVAPPDAETGLALFTPPGMEDRIGTFVQVILTCDDIFDTHAELVDEGVTFSQEPEIQSWGAAAQLDDAEGNTFILTQRPKAGRPRGATAS